MRIRIKWILDKMSELYIWLKYRKIKNIYYRLVNAGFFDMLGVDYLRKKLIQSKKDDWKLVKIVLLEDILISPFILNDKKKHKLYMNNLVSHIGVKNYKWLQDKHKNHFFKKGEDAVGFDNVGYMEK